MAHRLFNNNPCGRNVGDCAVRAVSKALGTDWESAYITLTVSELQDLMRNAPDERTRQKIQSIIYKMDER